MIDVIGPALSSSYYALDELSVTTRRARGIAGWKRRGLPRRRLRAQRALLAAASIYALTDAARGVGFVAPGANVLAGFRPRARHKATPPATARKVLPPPPEDAVRTETSRRVVGSDGNDDGDKDASPFLNPTTGSLLLLVLALLYGASSPLLKSVESVAPKDFDGAEILTLRFLFAFAPLLPWLAGNVRAAFQVLRPGAELGVWLWAGYTLQVLGLETVSASTATVIFALCGLMVQALEFVFDRKPLSPPTVLSTLGALAGLGIFVTAQNEAPGLPTFSGVADKVRVALEKFYDRPAPHEAFLQGVPGEALVLLGTLFFAVHVWRSAALGVESGGSDSEEAPADSDGDQRSLALAAVQMMMAVILSIGFSCIDSAGPLGERIEILNRLDSSVWARVIACGVFSTGIPQLLELFALRVTPPSQAALIYCTIPVWGVLLSVVFLGEPLSMQAMLGGVLIVGCSVPWTSLEGSGRSDNSATFGSTLEDVAPRVAMGAASAIASSVLSLAQSEDIVAKSVMQDITVASQAATIATQAASTTVSAAASPTAQIAAQAAATAAAAAASPAAQIATQAASATATPAAQIATQAASTVAFAASSPAGQIATQAASKVASAAASPAAQIATQAASTAASAAATPVAQIAASAAANSAAEVAAQTASAIASAAASPAAQIAGEAASAAASAAASPAGGIAMEAASAAASAAASPVGQILVEAASAAASVAASPAGQIAAEAASAAASIAASPAGQLAMEAASAAASAASSPAGQMAVEAAATVAAVASL